MHVNPERRAAHTLRRSPLPAVTYSLRSPADGSEIASTSFLSRLRSVGASAWATMPMAATLDDGHSADWWRAELEHLLEVRIRLDATMSRGRRPPPKSSLDPWPRQRLLS